MQDILWIIVGITLAFFLIFIIREITNKKKICVICTAVTLTWVSLLILYWKGLFDNQLIIALLMGQTILGIFYLSESKVKKELKLFRLPFLLSLIVIGYIILTLDIRINLLIFLLILWILFILIYSLRTNKKVGSLVKKIVECCKEW